MRRTFALLALASAVLACSDSTAPQPLATELLGRWSTTPSPLQPSGTIQFHLTFTSNFRFTAESRSYGVYADQSAGELSGYTRTTGSYRTDGARLILTPDSLITWDRFYGATSPEMVQTPYGGALYDKAQFTVDGDRLTLSYTIYPADAPEPATQQFQRQ